MDRGTEDVLGAVGPRLRALRRQRGVTLADVAATTGISESTLSRLESGQRKATLELLLPLARTYDVPLDDLVGAPRMGDPLIHLKPVQRFGMTFVPLSMWVVTLLRRLAVGARDSSGGGRWSMRECMREWGEGPASVPWYALHWGPPE